MDRDAQREKQIQQIKISRMLSYSQLVKDKYHDKPGVYDTFLGILYEYTKHRIDPAAMHRKVSKLFSAHPELIEGFCNYLPQEMFIKDVIIDDFWEFLRPAKKTKVEDYSTTGITEFGPTSKASTSYASNQSPRSSGCYPLEWEIVAPYSGFSPSQPGIAAEASEAPKSVIAGFRGGTLYIRETKTRHVDGPRAYEHLNELVKEINRKRINIYHIMQSAAFYFQGYPELLESFNGFLPEGFRIVFLSEGQSSFEELQDLKRNIHEKLL